jgi:hypothetical protein
MDHLSLATEMMQTAVLRQTTWNAATLAFWLRDGCRCVYCERNMLESYDTAYYNSTVDHLLPVSTFPELQNVEWNRVLACRACNGFKGAWDANVPLLYVKGTQTITADDRQVLFERAKGFVADKRRTREELFKQEHALVLAELQRSSAASSGGNAMFSFSWTHLIPSS